MRIVIAVLIGLVSAIVGTWFAFFNPGIGVVMSVSIILYIQSTQQLRSHLELIRREADKYER